MDNEKFIKNVLSIKNKINNIPLEYLNLYIEKKIKKFSSLKKLRYHLKIDNKLISNKDKLLFKYKCIYCDEISEINITQFLRKINKNKIRCYLCRNKDIIKRECQSKFMKNKGNDYKKPEIIKLSLEKKIKKSLEDFEKESSEFKEKYNQKHLTKDEFNRLSKNIISFNNGKYSDIMNYTFIPIISVSNQMKYTGVLKINETEIIFNTYEPILKCDNCDNTWKSKNIYRFKNSKKIFCKECSCTNKIFKIRPTYNICNQKINYQSKLEKKFIEFCNSEGLVLNNGPKIKYNFLDKEREYRVDFKVLDYLVEIKDFHKWFLDNIKSGKWPAKEQAAKIYCEENELNFLLITPKNWDKMLKLIID